MSYPLKAARAFRFFGRSYSEGDVVDTEGWPERAVQQLMADYPVYYDQSAGGSAGPESDPVAGPAVASEASRAQAAEASEATARGTADTTESTARSAADTAESSARSAADTTEAAARAAIAAQQATDESSAAAMQTAISARALATDLTAETTRASGAEAANTALINSHINRASAAHAGSAVSIDPTGLAVVTTTNVQAALAQLDTWANGRPTNEAGTLAAMPANGTRPNGSTYFATDQFGGTTYRMVAGVWTQQSAGVSQASGQMIAGPAQMSASFDVKAVGVTVTDVTGMTINVPASSRPVLLRAKFETQMNTGTAAIASIVRLAAYITDSANNILSVGEASAQQVTAVAVVVVGQINLEAYLPAPVAGGTYKIRASVPSGIPANWTSALLLPANGVSAAAVDNFYAVAC